MKKTLFAFIAIIIATCGYAQIPTNGLVSFYSFTGNANDTVSNNHGTVVSASLTTDRFGNPNSSYKFIASLNSGINLPSNVFHFSNYTYSFWMKMSTLPPLGDRSVLISIGGFGGDQGVSINNEYFGGVEQFDGIGSYSGGSTAVYTNGPKLDTGLWYHVVSVRDTNFVKTYVNGNLVAVSNSSNGALPTYGNSSGARIGSRFNQSLDFDGLIDDVRIYNRGINQNEVRALYQENACLFTVYDTVMVYDTVKIAVTDTLIIDAVFLDANQQKQINKIKVYPNPTNDRIFIDNGNFSLMSGYYVKIINASGQELFTSPINQQLVDINLDDFTGEGTYFIMLYDSNNNLMEVRKIILK
jgi:hypothetical protein